MSEKAKDDLIKQYINQYGEISTVQKICYSHRNQINRGLIIDLWSQFEFSVTTICNSILNPSETESLFNERYQEIVKIVGENNLTDEIKEKLKKKLTERHLTHIPITRKCDKLFKYCKNYTRDVNDDKQFLLFFGRVRNTMHSTYVFYGNDFEYVFDDIRTVFENGKPVYHRQPPGLKFYFHLGIELIKVFTAIISSIEHESKIEYPTMEES